MTSPWLIAPPVRSRPRLRLLCLPYAGGSAAAYRRWWKLAPGTIEVLAVELPGHGSRLRETSHTQLGPLVHAIGQAIEPILDLPYAIFGHSLGGLLGFELARQMRREGGALPVGLFVSATAAPNTPRSAPQLHLAPDDEVRDRLRTLRGTPRELLDNDELMQLVLPVVRADFTVLETYRYRVEPPLQLPITVYGGAFDRVVPPHCLEAWQDQTNGGSRLRLFAGDHFFIQTAAADLLADIATQLGLDGPWPASTVAYGQSS
jgi:surfactin synthase thioesterase subunit